MKLEISLNYDHLSDEEKQQLSELLNGSVVSTLIRDALADFRHRREPTAQYVGQRYSECNDRFRRFKLKEVEKRILTSHLLAKFEATIMTSLDGE